MSSFPEPWQRALAERADAHGNHDSALAETELDEELIRGNSGGEGTTRRISEQALATW